MTEDLQARIAQEKEETIQGWITHIDQSIEKALRGESQLTEKELAIRGFSPPTQRHLWNLLASNARSYCEVGLYGGASLASACKGNSYLTVYAIDNLSQNFGDPSIFTHLKENMEESKKEVRHFQFHEEDFFEMDLSPLLADPVDLAYYDGVHTPEAQGAALPHILPYLDDVAVVITDDAGWRDAVYIPTMNTVNRLKDEGKIKVHKDWYLSDGIPDGPRFHNDISILLIEKL